MSARAAETLLARLYSDDALRARFLSAPLVVAAEAGLDTEEARAFAAVDASSLQLAAHSYTRKREGHATRRLGTVRALLARLWGR